MAANKGVAWMRKHHFDNKGPLPYRVAKKKKKLPSYNPNG